MDFISKSISNGLYLVNYLTNLKNKDDKNIIIDPMSCLIKLSILKFCPIGTKISIGDNMITILDPGLLQGAVRFIKGDGREDLHNLYIPLIKSIEWYYKSKIDSEIKTLFDFSINGLEILKLSYPINSTICHTLDLYIHHLTTKQTNTLYDKELKLEENNKIHDYLKQLWTQREIHIIIELLLEYEINIQNNKKETQLLQSILIMTTAKELKLKDFLKNHFASL
uniref:Uncharacterized protein n=1 Tax=viral metagenome TaxID=1070528 RepID=A0A6C0HUW5_9ZZZZ